MLYKGLSVKGADYENVKVVGSAERSYDRIRSRSQAGSQSWVGLLSGCQPKGADGQRRGRLTVKP